MESLRSGDPVQVGDYRLLGRLGEGGMGSVFLGVTPGGRQVAVKVMRPDLASDPEFRYRFAREADAAYFVGGFYTAQLVDAEPDDIRPWMASAYIPGPSLSEVVTATGPLDPDAVCRLGAALAECLIAIHERELIHRDLKPSNVIMSDDGPRVIDFGIVRPVQATSLTTTGTIIGSYPYMSPEHLSGKGVVPESDIFSLGGVLTYAATGHGPFDATYKEQIETRILTRPPDLTPLTGGLREILGACLEKQPGDRPALRDLLSWFSDAGQAAGAGYQATITTPGKRGLTASAAPLTAHYADIAAIAFSPDGRLLATADTKLNLILWDTATWTPIRPPVPLRPTSGEDGWLGAIAFSPDSRLLTSLGYYYRPREGSLAGRHLAWVWNIADLWLPDAPLELPGRDPLISPGGRHLVTPADWATKDTTAWDIGEGPFKPRTLDEGELGDSSYRPHPVFSPDGRFFADHGKRDVRLWDLTTGALVPVPVDVGESWNIGHLALSPGASQLAVTCDQIPAEDDKTPGRRNLRLLSTIAGQPAGERVLHENTYGFNEPRFSPDGRLLACHANDEVRVAWIWDAASGSPVDLITYVDGWLAFSPDSRFLATDQGRSFSIRDLIAGRTIRASRDTGQDEFKIIAFSPDSRMLASSAGTTVRIWTLPDA